MTISEILENSMYKRQELIIMTKTRGEIRGVPHALDEFNTDPNRLGYYIEIGEYLDDVVFLDEITGISEIKPIKISAEAKSQAV